MNEEEKDAHRVFVEVVPGTWDELCVAIPQPVLDLVGWKEATEVEVRVSDGVIVVRKAGAP